MLIFVYFLVWQKLCEPGIYAQKKRGDLDISMQFSNEKSSFLSNLPIYRVSQSNDNLHFRHGTGNDMRCEVPGSLGNIVSKLMPALKVIEQFARC